MAQNFNGENIDKFDEFYAICQYFIIQTFLFQWLFTFKDDTIIRQNFSCLISSQLQFIKIFHSNFCATHIQIGTLQLV